MKKYKYVLLDWDGNLAKTLDLWLAAFRVAFEKLNVHLSDEEIASTFGQFDSYCAARGIEDVAAAYDVADRWA